MRPSQEVSLQFLNKLFGFREDIVSRYRLADGTIELPLDKFYLFNPKSMLSHRSAIWGIKDGRSVSFEQKGSEIRTGPGMDDFQLLEPFILSALTYLDELVEFWHGHWSSDDELREKAEDRNRRRVDREPSFVMTVEMWRSINSRNTARLRRRQDSEKVRSEIESLTRKAQMTDAELVPVIEEMNVGIRALWNRVETMESLRKDEEEEFVSRNVGPPFSWDSIADCLLPPGTSVEITGINPAKLKPSDLPKCRECFLPCRWVWYWCFPGPTCGSAGWVAICDSCQTWHKERTAIVC